MRGLKINNELASKMKGNDMKYYQTTNQDCFSGLSINNGCFGNLSCYSVILQDILYRFRLMTERHNKVLFVRFDLHFPDGHICEGFNQELSDFFKLFKEYYTRKGIDTHYIWVREQSKKNHRPHYHCVVLFDGNKIQKYYPVLEKAAEIWARVIGADGDGLVNFCNKDYDGRKVENGIMIYRPSSLATGERLYVQQRRYEEDYDKCFRWASYLAKVNQKKDTPFSARRYGVSRISKNLFDRYLAEKGELSEFA